MGGDKLCKRDDMCLGLKQEQVPDADDEEKRTF
jgi:hypothetical protein